MRLFVFALAWFGSLYKSDADSLKLLRTRSPERHLDMTGSVDKGMSGVVCGRCQRTGRPELIAKEDSEVLASTLTSMLPGQWQGANDMCIKLRDV